jgi:hypothetical protein
MDQLADISSWSLMYPRTDSGLTVTSQKSPPSRLLGRIDTVADVRQFSKPYILPTRGGTGLSEVAFAKSQTAYSLKSPNPAYTPKPNQQSFSGHLEKELDDDLHEIGDGGLGLFIYPQPAGMGYRIPTYPESVGNSFSPSRSYSGNEPSTQSMYRSPSEEEAFRESVRAGKLKVNHGDEEKGNAEYRAFSFEISDPDRTG